MVFLFAPTFLLFLGMKKNILFLLCSFIVVYSCKKHENSEVSSVEKSIDSVKTSSVFAVDSVKVNDSTKLNENISATFSWKILEFPTISNKSVLDSIYGVNDIHLENYSKESLKSALNSKMKDYFSKNKENTKDFPSDLEQTWNEHAEMDVFSRENDFLTLKYTGDGFSGGAHGYYYEYYKVFDLKNNKTLQLSDILMTPESSIWKRALMDNFLKNDLGKDQSQMLLVKEISPNRNFYFDQENIYFLYNQYEIAAYAAGPILIKIPISDVKMMLNSEWLKRMGIK